LCRDGLTQDDILAIFDAEPFQARSNPLRFRGIADSLAKYHVEGSECCLIHFDNPLTASKGVWVNPNVRVGYNLAAYEAMRKFPSKAEALLGWWKGFLATSLGLPWQQGKILANVREWEREDQANREIGISCLIDEMQVLVDNGWAHV
jgi:hypothetical protein